MPDVREQREKVLRRWHHLKNERESWFAHWQELARFFSPRSGRFTEFQGVNPNGGSLTGVTSSANRGHKAHAHILDNSPLRSVDVLAAGLTAGMTSPARRWFRLRTPDEKLNERHSVKTWLHEVEELMRRVYAESNTYRTFRRMYEELGVFGTAASIELSDFQDGIRSYPLTAGEYAISTNGREVVDTIYRVFDMTVEQLVDQFGYNNCSLQVQRLYDNKDMLAWIQVLHAIEPRRERDPFKIDNLNMAWKSCYMELGGEADKFLRVSGFRRFPALIPRWKTNGHDFYGEAPAMRALGDAKQLQQEQFRKGQAIDYQTQPPLQVPSHLSEVIAKGPGGVTVVPGVGDGIRSAWDVKLNLEYLLQDLRDVRQRVSQAMFEDMFLLFTTARRGVQPPTAEEIVAQQEEKLLMAGPVLENLHDELLSPKIEWTFEMLLEGGLLPPPPPEMHGQTLTIQFVSTLAQAQRLIGLNNLDRMVGTIVNLSTVKPSVLDKLDGDAVVNTYADSLGIDPDLIVADERVALIRQQRAVEQQQAKLTAALPAAAQTAKALGDTDPNVGNAVVQGLRQLGGVP